MRLSNQTVRRICQTLGRFGCLSLLSGATLMVADAQETLPTAEAPGTLVPNAPEGDYGGEFAQQLQAGLDGVDAESQEERLRVLPHVVDGHFVLPEMNLISTSTSNVGIGKAVGKTPPGYRGEGDPPTMPLPENGTDRGVDWTWTVAEWEAANTFSHPRYFEDRMLERHGHERFTLLQPFISGGRFLVTVPALPYLMTVREPCDCEYTLGYFRSGTCAPVMCQRPPYSRRAAIVEAGAISGAILAFP